MSAGGLNTRQFILKYWLKQNSKPGHWFTIEEIVENCKYKNEPLYMLNKNPRIHDKCVQLASDINDINDSEVDGYKILIKNEKGSVKFAENEQELLNYIVSIETPALKILKRCWTLRRKAKLDGTMPIINKADNAIKDKDLEFISAYINFDDEDMNIKIN